MSRNRNHKKHYIDANLAFHSYKYGYIKDKVIALLTNGPFYHVDLVLSTFRNENKLFGRCYSSSPKLGVHYRIDYLENTIILPIRLYKNPLKWMNEQIGMPYDWWTIISYYLPFYYEESNKWYCSELISTILNEFGHYDIPIKISVNSLYKSIKP